MGLRGIELRVRSGQKGFFEVRYIKGKRENISFGLATCEVDLCYCLGWAHDSIGWVSYGRVLCGPGMVGANFDHRRGLVAPSFTTGDVLGLMVDCSEEPILLFFVNGAQVGDMVFAEEAHGKLLVPVFTLSGDSEIEISPNPGLPGV